MEIKEILDNIVDFNNNILILVLLGAFFFTMFIVLIMERLELRLSSLILIKYVNYKISKMLKNILYLCLKDYLKLFLILNFVYDKKKNNKRYCCYIKKNIKRYYRTSIQLRYPPKNDKLSILKTKHENFVSNLDDEYEKKDF